MIHCQYCHTINAPNLDHCSNCQRTLLPGSLRSDRIKYLKYSLIPLALSVILFIVNKLLFTAGLVEIPEKPYAVYEHFLKGGNYIKTLIGDVLLYVGAILLFIFFYLLWLAIKPNPKHERYYQRALFHFTLDVEQTERDLNQAAMLKPMNGDYQYERGIFYEQQGKLETAKNAYQKAIDLGAYNKKLAAQALERIRKSSE